MDDFRFCLTKGQALRAATRQVELQAARLALAAQARLNTTEAESTLRQWARECQELAEWLAKFPDGVRIAAGRQPYPIDYLPCPEGGTHNRYSDHHTPDNIYLLQRLANVSARPEFIHCGTCRKRWSYWAKKACGLYWCVNVADPAIDPVPVPRFQFVLVKDGEKQILVAVEKSVLAQLPQQSLTPLGLKAGDN